MVRAAAGETASRRWSGRTGRGLAAERRHVHHPRRRCWRRPATEFLLLINGGRPDQRAPLRRHRRRNLSRARSRNHPGHRRHRGLKVETNSLPPNSWAVQRRSRQRPTKAGTPTSSMAPPSSPRNEGAQRAELLPVRQRGEARGPAKPGTAGTLAGESSGDESSSWTIRPSDRRSPHATSTGPTESRRGEISPRRSPGRVPAIYDRANNRRGTRTRFPNNTRLLYSMGIRSP